MRTLMAAALTLMVSSAALAEPFYVGEWAEFGTPCGDTDTLLITENALSGQDLACEISSVELDGSNAVVQAQCSFEDEAVTETFFIERSTDTVIRMTLPSEPDRPGALHRCDNLKALSKRAPREVQTREH